jgi:hypothetical protein
MQAAVDGRNAYDRSSMPILQPDHVAFLHGTRRAILATVAASGSPRLVPICFAVLDSGDPRDPLLAARREAEARR